MTREEALELVERMPYIRTIMVANDKLRLELYQGALASNDPVEWIKVIKTNYIRQNDKTARRYPDEAEMESAGRARELLYGQLSEALGIPVRDLDGFIEKHIKDTF